MSNISPRNCRLNRSVSFVFLMTEKSVLTKFGPVTALRLRLPGRHVGGAGAGFATQGDTNTVLSANQPAGSPVTWIGPVTSGRTVRLTPGLIASVGFRGLPDCACITVPTSHPATKRFALNGNW